VSVGVGVDVGVLVAVGVGVDVLVGVGVTVGVGVEAHWSCASECPMMIEPLKTPIPVRPTLLSDTWMALTVIDRLVAPSPPMICSLRTTWIPSALISTVFGAGVAETLTLAPDSVAAGFVKMVEPVAISGPPQGPSMLAVDWTWSAVSVTSGSSPTMARLRLLTVAAADTESVVWTDEVAVACSRPVLRMEPVATVETEAEAALLLLEYGGGAAPVAVGNGPLVMPIGPPMIGARVRLTDSPNARLVAVESDVARAGRSNVAPYGATRVR
jgi:hypothetical protein